MDTERSTSGREDTNTRLAVNVVSLLASPLSVSSNESHRSVKTEASSSVNHIIGVKRAELMISDPDLPLTLAPVNVNG